MNRFAFVYFLIASGFLLNTVSQIFNNQVQSSPAPALKGKTAEPNMTYEQFVHGYLQHFKGSKDFESYARGYCDGVFGSGVYYNTQTLGVQHKITLTLNKETIAFFDCVKMEGYVAGDSSKIKIKDKSLRKY